MPLTQSRIFHVVAATLVMVTAHACAHARQQPVGSEISSCANPVLTVHNNTNGDIDVYAYRSGVGTIIATVRPGTQKVTLTDNNPRISYVAQPVGRTEILTTTGSHRTSDKVTLARGCE